MRSLFALTLLASTLAGVAAFISSPAFWKSPTLRANRVVRNFNAHTYFSCFFGRDAPVGSMLAERRRGTSKDSWSR